MPVALDAGVARELGVTVGDSLVWDVQGVRVPSRVACLREVNWARFEPNFFVLFPEGPLDDAPQTFVLLSRVEDPTARARLQRSVVDAHPNVSTLDLTQVQRAIEAILDRVVLAIRFMALFSLAAGAVVLVGAVAASRYQRVREGALLRTLGATRSQLLRILLAEYAVLGILASSTAIALSTLAGFVLVRFVFEGHFSVPGPSMLTLVLTVMVMTVVVGLSGSTEVWTPSAARGAASGVTYSLIVTFISTRSVAVWPSTGVRLIWSTTSMPEVTSPKTVYCPLSEGWSCRQTKNWVPALSTLEGRRTAATVPRTKGRSENSAFRSPSPPVP